MGKELDEKTKELLLQVKKLKQKNQKLEEELEVTKFNLGERRKELNCYQVIMEYVNNPDLSVEKVLSAIVKIIPSSWQFPELTAAEIVVGNKRYQTNPFKTSKYFIRQDLSIKKEVVGHISVYFTGKLNEQLTEPFLPEEGYLLTSIAKIIDEFLSKEKKRRTIVEDEREKYQNLINNLKEVVFETSPEGNVRFVSPSVKQLLGYEVNELTGRQLFNLVHPDDLSLIKESYDEYLKEESRDWEIRVKTKSGKYKWIHITSRLAFKNGKVTGRTGVLYDIHETKTTGIKLKESSEKYRALVENINEIIFEFDKKGIIIFISPQVEQVLGYSYREIVGRHFSMFVGENSTYLEKRMKELSEKVQLQGNYLFPTKKGEKRWIRLSSNAIIRDGEFCGGSGMMVDITEEKRINLELARSEAFHRTMINSSPDVIAITDMDGYITMTSPMAMKMFGYKKTDFSTGKNILEFINPEEHYKALDAIKHMLEGNYIGSTEYKAIKADGSNFPIEVNGGIVKDEDGKPLDLIYIIRDVSERKKAEAEVLRLSMAVNQSPVSIVITNLDGDIEYANPKACETTGYSLDELLGQNPRVLKSGETTSQEYDNLWDSISHGNIWHGIFHNKRKNGEFYWESAQIAPIKNEEDELVGYFAVKEDITERIEMQEALKESENRFRQVAEQSQTVIWETDSHGVYTYLSPAVCAIWGYNPKDLVGHRTFWDIHPEEGKKEFINACFKDIKNKQPFRNLESQIVRKDGKAYWMLTNGMPVLDPDGNLLGYRGSSLNITDKIQSERILKESQDMLNYAQELAGMGSWEVDLDRNIVQWSKNYYKILELEEKEKNVSFDYFKEKVHPDDQFILDDALDNILNSKQPVNIEHRLLMPDGRVKWVENKIHPELGKKGNLYKLKGILLDITDRKKTAEKLIRSEKQLKEAHKLARVCSWEYDFRTSKTDWSETTYDIFEIDPAIEPSFEYLKKERVHPEDIQLFDKFTEQLLKEKKKHSFEYRAILPDGEILWIYNEAIPIFKNNDVVGLKGFNQDITFKKNSELEIKAKNDKLNAVIGAIPDLIFVIDKDGTYLEYYASDESELLVRAEQIIGSNLYDTFPKEAADFHIKQFRKCLKLNHLVNYEYFIDLQGEKLFYEARISPLDADSVLVLSRNITESRKQNLQIKKLSLAISQSPVITVITDLKANIEYVNPAFEKITGYTKEEVIGKNVRILQSGKTSREIYEDLWQTINDGKTWHGEWMNKNKDGNLYWEDVLITPITDENGLIVNYLAVKQDITVRKLAEKEIADLNTNLEQKVIERTKQLAESNSRLQNEAKVREQAEIALSQSEKKYRSVVENVKEVIYIADKRGRCIFLNKAWEDVTGFPVGETIGKPFFDYVYFEDKALNKELFKELILRKKDYVSREGRIITKDGGYKWIEANGGLLLTDDGEISGVYGTAQDITERKWAEAFENELLQMTPKLAGVSFNEIDGAIDMALGRIGRFLGADRSYIFEFSADQKMMNNSYAWNNNGIRPEKNNLQDIPIDNTPEMIKILRKKENIVIPKVEDLPKSWAAEKAILIDFNIKSLLAIPILVENKLIGYFGLDNIKSYRNYSTTEQNILKVWSGMLASLIQSKHTESLMQQTRQNYEAFFNTMDDYLLILDFKGHIIDINKSIEERLGYYLNELKGKSALLVRPENRREEAGSILVELLSGNKEFCSIPLVTKSGELIPVETRVKKGFWNGQEVLFSMSKDISQIKLSEEKFSLAFYGSQAMMAISHFTDGDYLDVNPAFIEKVGYTEKELIGHSNSELNLFPNPELRRRITDDLGKNIPVQKMEIEWRNKKGELRNGLLSADSFYIGKEKYLLTVTIDITERLKAEGELRRARKEAEFANTAKSEFLSRMSHELRTPLNSILGFAQLLGMGDLNASQSKGVTHIMKSGKHLLDLINEVLDISRIEAGRLSLSLEPVSVNYVIKEMNDVIKPQAESRNITIDYNFKEEENLYIKTDKQRVKQILLNLMSNAVKYNKEGESIILETMLVPGSANPKRVRISITDHGIGISPKNLKKLFNPFERIGADKTAIEGTGLGLAVVKKLVDALGGKVGVKSKLGEGSTFWVEFPYCDGMIKNQGLDKSLNEAEKILEAKQGVILYIEDNESNVDLIEEILSNQRSCVKIITDMYGENAIDLAVKHSPDIILLDLNLPDKHGHEVLKDLKNDEKTSDIPVVIISADAMPRQLERLKKAGAYNYLTKPLEIAEFLKVIDNLLDYKKRS